MASESVKTRGVKYVLEQCDDQHRQHSKIIKVSVKLSTHNQQSFAFFVRFDETLRIEKLKKI